MLLRSAEIQPKLLFLLIYYIVLTRKIIKKYIKITSHITQCEVSPLFLIITITFTITITKYFTTF